MDKFLEKHNLWRLNHEEIENIKRPTQALKLKMWLKIFQQTKAQDQLTSQVNSIKHLRANTYPSQTFPKYSRGRNTPQLILRGHHHPDTKTRQRCHKERKLLANISDEHRCRNPQQNTNKQNPTTHWKDHAPWSSEFYPRNAKILHYIEINQCDTPY